jgi:putative transcriptional regulator
MASQRGIKFAHAVPNELDPAIGTVEVIENFAVENEYAINTATGAQRPAKCGMIVRAQITSEPDKYGLIVHRGLRQAVISQRAKGGAIVKSRRCVYNRHEQTSPARGKRALKPQSMQSVNLTHHFLIAMPNMADPHFSKTLTYICEHNEKGALGVVINRPIDLMLSSLLEQVSIPVTDERCAGIPIHYGGPVQTDRGFVLHGPVGNWQSTLSINADLGLTTSKDILQAVAHGDGPEQIFVTLGYAGWAAGQIENELAQNAWLTVPADHDVMFALPCAERVPAAMHLLGIDFASLSEVAGHA